MKRLLTLLLPWLVGLAALAITAVLALHEQRTQQQTLRASFDLGLRQTANRVEQRIASYELVLRGAQGLFRAAERVDAAAFSTYVDALLAGADFAGLQAIGHAPALRAAGGRLSSPVTFVAPAIGQNLTVLGFDLQDEPVRRAAMLQSRDSGSIAITRKLRLLIDPESGPQNGFLMVLPLYAPGQPLATVDERRRHHRGWVFAAFRMSDLMSSLYGEGMPGLEVRIHDGVALNDATLMYQSGGAQAQAARFEAQEYIGFAGHTWTLVVRTQADFDALHNLDAPRIIVIAGIGVSLLLALLTQQLVRGRERAHAVAQRMTRQLRDSEERYRRIVETADEGIWMGDAEQRTSFVNPKALQMLGYEAGQLIGLPLTVLLEEPGRAQVAASLALRDQAATTHHELQLRRKDGTALWASLAMNPIIDAAGHYAGALAMFTDISQARQAEARRSVLESQLRESQKMEAIGTLAGGIAHDFNNILAAILGNAALAREQLAPGHPAAAHLAQIGQAGGHARNLVQQIVAFGRRQPLARVAQPLAPLVEASMTLLRATLPAAVDLQVVLPAEPVWARVDGNQFQQVLMNLCTNAWHALHGSSGRVTVGLAVVTLDADGAQALGHLRPGPHARLWVSDSGSGMDAATRARIFEPFFTTKPVGQGTGLGLSVVHGIVAAHEGAIAVHSTPGEGSRFEVYLPQLPAPAQPPTTDRAAAPPQQGQGERVLYVDDDPVMVTLVEALLDRAGYAVSCFGDARAALAALQAEPAAFDLVITDYNMPELSGLDVVQALRSVRPALPVIISSGYLSEDMRAAAAQAGVPHLLQKEYTVEQLVPLVQQVLAAQNRK
ncbi:CHASE domain-containing protein [Aquabacterium sp.]|uniref:CHASE domain-containing protein n=1 Tax=Aquabacterium sp. TaxID=1872578 RepID=UPI002CEEBBA7|nr:CHASE domain-containing protein [Aquabacterium sp.]HSW04902.1 CHASE domain-containing protein [Aquabacterium sp.]